VVVSSQLAWFTLVGTLGGVIITATFSLLSTYFCHRWQVRRMQHEDELAFRRDVRSDRRQKYAEYIMSAQGLFDSAFNNYVRNRGDPVELAAFSLDLPSDLASAVVRNESLRVEALLLAGDSVRRALDEYDAWLKKFYPAAGSGVAISNRELGDRLYSKLISSMRDEVTNRRS
jgi:hypothetical protein